MSNIGITENGDASVDYSWVEKLEKMDMGIIITKNVTDKFIDNALSCRDKIIVHATCTGYGGTVLEPGVMPYDYQLEQIRKLISRGFPAEHVVVRIDPVFPTEKGCRMFETIVEKMHDVVKRYRISVIDNYKHVQERFCNAGLPVLFNGNFSASRSDFERVDASVNKVKTLYPDIHIESCAEPQLTQTEKKGCVSADDIKAFGLEVPERKGENRNGCLCESKKELLPYNHFWYCRKFKKEVSGKSECEFGKCKECKEVQIYGCKNRCLYCYWRT